MGDNEAVASPPPPEADEAGAPHSTSGPTGSSFAVPIARAPRRKKEKNESTNVNSDNDTTTNRNASSAPAAPPLVLAKDPGQYGLWVPPERVEEDKQAELEQQQQQQLQHQQLLETDVQSNSSGSQKTAPSADSAAAAEIPLMYEVPFWSAPPKFRYKLELLKDGVSQGFRNVWQKPFYVVGRAPVCDIRLDHPSISRQHAIIQFRKNGEAYLYDLGSSHGSFLGKIKVTPRTYVPIVRGKNVIKFGQSSRIYVLDYPEPKEEENTGNEEEDAKARKKLEKQEKKEKQKEARKQKWKDLKEKKKQEKKQQRGTNDEEGDNPLEGLDDEDEEFAALNQHADFYREYFEDDTDDSFYDRTGREKKKKEKNTTKEIETYDTLIAKKRLIDTHMKLLEDEIVQLEKGSEQQPAEKPTDDPNEDELSSFMSGINSTLVKDKIARKKKLLRELEADNKRITSLANIVKPALESLSDTSNFTDAQIKVVQAYTRELQQRKLDTDGDSKSESEHLEQKQKQAKARMKELAVQAKETRKAQALEKKMQKSRGVVAVPSLPPGFTEESEFTKEDETNQSSEMEIESTPSETNTSEDGAREPGQEAEPKRPSHKQSSLLAGMTELMEKQRSDEKRKKRKMEQSENDGSDEEDNEHDGEAKPKKRRKKKLKFDADHQNYSNWAPPVGQTGDGRTHLNEKFGY